MRIALILITLATWFTFGAVAWDFLDNLDREYAAETRI